MLATLAIGAASLAALTLATVFFAATRPAARPAPAPARHGAPPRPRR